MSLSNFAENEIADWLCANGAPSTVTAVFVKLHIGDPGEDGTGNPAAHTTREEASFSAASGGAITNDADIEFTPLAADETISYVSGWDAATNGNCLWISNEMADPQAVNAGGLLRIPAGDLDITIN
jgi:hypothetical protein